MFTFVDLHLQGDLPVSWRLNGLHFLFGHQDGADHVQASPIDIFANLSPRLHGFLIFFYFTSTSQRGLQRRARWSSLHDSHHCRSSWHRPLWRPCTGSLASSSTYRFNVFFTFRRLAKLWRSPSCAVWELLFACSSSPTCCSCPTWASTS